MARGLWDEAFFPLERGEIKAELDFELGVLLGALHPDLEPEQITSNRGKYLKYIIQGLHDIQYLGWECIHGGQTGLWVPVKIPDHFMPSITSPDDFVVRLSVSLPFTNAFHGMAVEKYPLRLTGKRSLAQLNALRTAYWLWHTHGTHSIIDKQGKRRYRIIDTTKPIENRDDQGFLLNAQGEQVLTSRGSPVKNIYHPAAVDQLPREPNPAKDKYPILPFEDLTRACFPMGYKDKSTYEGRAKKAWEALQKVGFVEIEKHGQKGWRILPSARHIQAYRGLSKAIKHSEKIS